MPSNLPSPCWGAIVIRLAALTPPSGPCRGVWAQLDSPITSQQIQQLSQTSLQSCSFFWEAEKLERHVITAIMIMIAAACLIPLQAANGAVVAGYKLLQLWEGTLSLYFKLVTDTFCQFCLSGALLCSKLPWVSSLLIPARVFKQKLPQKLTEIRHRCYYIMTQPEGRNLSSLHCRNAIISKYKCSHAPQSSE